MATLAVRHAYITMANLFVTLSHTNSKPRCQTYITMANLAVTDMHNNGKPGCHRSA